MDKQPGPPGPPPEFRPGPPPSGKPMGPPPHARGEGSMEVIEEFLEMPPEKLAMIRVMIERIEQMTPAERAAMRERLSCYRELTQERRARMQEEFNQVPVENRLLLRMYWRSLPPEVAKAERKKLFDMAPEERAEYRDELLAKAREAGISLRPPTPPPDIRIPPPPELLPPPFPADLMPPPPPPAASAGASADEPE